MKKVLVAAVLGTFALTACKKDYTCTCKVSGQNISLPYTKVKKADAEDACNAAQTTYKNADASASCSLN